MSEGLWVRVLNLPVGWERPNPLRAIWSWVTSEQPVFSAEDERGAAGSSPELPSSSRGSPGGGREPRGRVRAPGQSHPPPPGVEPGSPRLRARQLRGGGTGEGTAAGPGPSPRLAGTKREAGAAGAHTSPPPGQRRAALPGPLRAVRGM